MSTGNFTINQNIRDGFVSGLLDFSTGDWRAILLTSSAPLTTASTYSQVSSYQPATGGYAEDSITVTITGSNDSIVNLGSAEFTATGASITARYVAYYDHDSGYLCGYATLNEAGTDVMIADGETLTIGDTYGAFVLATIEVVSVNGQNGIVVLDASNIYVDKTAVSPVTISSTLTSLGNRLTSAEGSITTLNGLVPTNASSSNKLTDKAYVDDSITKSSAYFRGSFASYAALTAVSWQTSDPTQPYYVSNNDYAYVEDDETHNDEAWRYLYVLETGNPNNGWNAQFMVNETPLTTAQVNALNSGITDTLVTQIGTNTSAIAGKYTLPSGGIPKTDLASAVQTSLGLADTAIQSVPVTSVAGKTGAVTLSDTDISGLGGAAVKGVTDKTADADLGTSDTNVPTARAVTYNTRKWMARTTYVNAADTNYTTYMARGVALVSAATNPTVNGTLNFQYS